MNANELIKKIDWEKVDTLIPVIVQDTTSDDVLMLGYMNDEAIRKTFEDKKLTFYSRTKQRLWQKGETSGHFLEFVSVELDCDQDTLLVQANPHGPTCHTGNRTCFSDHKAATGRVDDRDFLFTLEQIIRERKSNPLTESYTSELFGKGINKIAQKLGEESVETVIAGLNESDESLKAESADLIYHLFVLLAERDISLSDVIATLQKRHTSVD